MHKLALFAGSAAAAIFMISQLPMLIKACRTKNLTSYSFANIGLANLGNMLYAVYVFQVPIGPVWAIHGFNLTTSGLMLFWYLRYGWRPVVVAGGAVVKELPELSGDPSAANPAAARAEQREPYAECLGWG
jgi:uncharacterized protein with PQ loop repeat